MLTDSNVPIYYGRFTFETFPIPHTFCGKLRVSQKFNGVELTTTSDPVYETATVLDSTVWIYTVDYSYAGTVGELRIKYFLVGYPEIFAEKVSKIVFNDPCERPNGLIVQNMRE